MAVPHPVHETSDHKDASFSERRFCASFLETARQRHHPFTRHFKTAAVEPMTHNHLQTVAAFIVCHTEADLHADCTCMNAHTHSHHKCFFVILFVFFFFFYILYYLIFHWYWEFF